MQKTLRIIGGFALVVVGVIGIIMPVMPGWIFLIPGLVMLSDHFTWAKRTLKWAREKVEGKKPGKEPC